LGQTAFGKIDIQLGFAGEVHKTGPHRVHLLLNCLEIEDPNSLVALFNSKVFKGAMELFNELLLLHLFGGFLVTIPLFVLKV
jgi:hypothetical protein